MAQLWYLKIWKNLFMLTWKIRLLIPFEILFKILFKERKCHQLTKWTIEDLRKPCRRICSKPKDTWVMKLLRCVTYDSLYTPSYLYNITYINKIKLSLSLFTVPYLLSLKASCEIHSWDLKYAKVSIYLLIW